MGEIVFYAILCYGTCFFLACILERNEDLGQDEILCG